MIETENLKDLIKQRNEILPVELDRAIEAGDVSAIVKNKRKSDLLETFILAEQLANTKSEIKAKQEEKNAVDVELKTLLEPKLLEAKNAFLQAYAEAQKLYEFYGRIQIACFAKDQQHQVVTDDLQILNRKLIEMKNKLHNDGEKQ